MRLPANLKEFSHMFRHVAHAACLLALISVAPTTASAAGDAESGKATFRKCMACHKIGEGATIGVGPVLTGVIGRKAGTFEGYTYSSSMKGAGDLGLVWTEEAIAAYLADPAEYLKTFLTAKGKPDLFTTAKMAFKLTEEAQRADVIAYLKTFSK
jgi:cytochrome c